MINLFFPFILLSLISLVISKSFKINLNKSYLISTISIPLFIFFIGNFVSIYWSIYIILLITLLVLILNFNFKKIFTSETPKYLLFYFIIYLLIILYTSNLFFYKYDEFSEYGIVSKLIFFEEELMNNIDYIFAKGSPHKINIAAYLNYFFLKTSLLEYKEQTLYIAQNTLNIIIIFNIVDYISDNIKKIIYFIILFFLSFVLSTGFDKIYLDTTAALLISLIITIQFQERNDLKYLIIFLAMIYLFCLKTSATIIFLGIFSIFTFYYFLEKNYKNIFFYFLILLSSFGIEKFYSYNFYFHSSNQEFNEKVNLDNISYSLNYKNKFINIKNTNTDELFSKSNFLILKKNFSDLSEKGIYHSSTFLIFNKIFQKLKINFKLIEIPLTLFFWVILLMILIKIINMENKFKLFLFVNTYILFIFFYWLIILYWAWSNRLINEDLSIEVSWQRHIGTIVLGILLYLIVILFEKNKIDKKQIIVILVFISIISKPNSFRNFFPKEFIIKDEFWMQAYNQRTKLDNLSRFVDINSEKYSTVFIFGKNENAYFFPILNYELIDKNLLNINLKFFEKKYDDYIKNSLLFKKINKFYILSNDTNKDNVMKLIKSKNFNLIFKKDFKNQYSIYKISL